MTLDTASIDYAAFQAAQAIGACAQGIQETHASWGARLQPKLSKDGTMWCALYGESLQEGISGFGPTPAKALLAFEIAVCSEHGTHNIEPRA